MSDLRKAAQAARDLLADMPIPDGYYSAFRAVIVPLDAALAEQPQPVAAKGPWNASHDGRTLQSDDFTHDVLLRISGDFEDDAQRVLYARALAAQLNAAPPTREPVRLTHMQAVMLWKDRSDGPSTAEIVSFARAVESAVLAANGMKP